MHEEEIDFGPVRVIDGPYKGRIAYIDDDEYPRAVIYFTEPSMAKDYRVPYAHLEPLRPDEVAAFYIKARHLLMKHTTQTLVAKVNRKGGCSECPGVTDFTKVHGIDWVLQNFPLLRWLVQTGHAGSALYEEHLREKRDADLDVILPWEPSQSIVPLDTAETTSTNEAR